MTLINTAIGAPAGNEGEAGTGTQPPITGSARTPTTAKKSAKEKPSVGTTPIRGKPKHPTIAADKGHEASRKKAAASGSTKAGIVLRKLRTVRGVTIIQLAEATGWQVHSVRGFLSAVVRKKLGLALVTEIGKDGMRRYRIFEEDQQNSVVGVGTGDLAGEV